MSFALYLAALFCALSAIHLTIAWRDWPPQGLEFDSQITRALLNVLAWLVLIMAVVFAIRLFGVLWPLGALAVVWALLTLIRRNVSLTRLYRLALPLSVGGLVCVLLLFQGVFQDSDFGLFNVFPPDR